MIAQIGKIGGQVYGDKTIYRSKRETKKALNSLNGIPILLGHHWDLPPDSSLQIGIVEYGYIQDNAIMGKLKLDVALEKGTGFSLGYEATLNGDNYVDIEYDHLAIVDNPRCGSLCRL